MNNAKCTDIVQGDDVSRVKVLILYFCCSFSSEKVENRMKQLAD